MSKKYVSECLVKREGDLINEYVKQKKITVLEYDRYFKHDYKLDVLSITKEFIDYYGVNKKLVLMLKTRKDRDAHTTLCLVVRNLLMKGELSYGLYLKKYARNYRLDSLNSNWVISIGQAPKLDCSDIDSSLITYSDKIELTNSIRYKSKDFYKIAEYVLWGEIVKNKKLDLNFVAEYLHYLDREDLILLLWNNQKITNNFLIENQEVLKTIIKDKKLTLNELYDGIRNIEKKKVVKYTQKDLDELDFLFENNLLTESYQINKLFSKEELVAFNPLKSVRLNIPYNMGIKEAQEVLDNYIKETSNEIN